MPAPYEFQNTENLVRQLQKSGNKLGKWFNGRHETIEDAVRASVGGNTFRSFHKMPFKPSLVFRQWALNKFKKEDAINSLLRISSQTEYDAWLKGLALSLNTSWKRKMGRDNPLSYGPRRKLPNLLLKQLVLWKGIKSNQRKRLIGFLDVPLDRYTLVAIRNCLDQNGGTHKGCRIPKNPTMGFVKNQGIYNEIQYAMRAIAKRAGVPPIFLDILAWDLVH